MPLPGGCISFNHRRNPFDCHFRLADLAWSAPEALVIEFQWQWAAAASFVDIELSCYDEQDQVLASDRQIVETRKGRSDSITRLKIPERAVTGKLSLQNAWGHTSITLSNVRLNFLGNQSDRSPRSAVGIVAADHTMLADAIDEMVMHYDHYRASAHAFSGDWASLHDPQRTFEKLIPQKKQLRYAA